MYAQKQPIDEDLRSQHSNYRTNPRRQHTRQTCRRYRTPYQFLQRLRPLVRWPFIRAATIPELTLPTQPIPRGFGRASCLTTSRPPAAKVPEAPGACRCMRLSEAESRETRRPLPPLSGVTLPPHVARHDRYIRLDTAPAAGPSITSCITPMQPRAVIAARLIYQSNRSRRHRTRNRLVE